MIDLKTKKRIRRYSPKDREEYRARIQYELSLCKAKMRRCNDRGDNPNLTARLKRLRNQIDVYEAIIRFTKMVDREDGRFNSGNTSRSNRPPRRGASAGGRRRY